jgi:putative phosphonate metabolism protein
MSDNGSRQARYAIYFSPRPGTALYQLGSQWLGRDAFDGRILAPQLSDGPVGENWEAATESPRRYGFHATLKPPFRLAEEVTCEALLIALREFAGRSRRFEAPPLQVTPLGRFVALTLSEPSSEFSQLAADCVREFDRFRAPATEAELAARLHDSMTETERAHVHRWGYPYVFDTWKFHMSLTGSLRKEMLPPFEDHLAAAFAGVCRHPFAVDSICVFHEPAPGLPLRLIEQVDLRSR